jgi:hypothetical protein
MKMKHKQLPTGLAYQEVLLYAVSKHCHLEVFGSMITGHNCSDEIGGDGGTGVSLDIAGASICYAGELWVIGTVLASNQC